MMKKLLPLVIILCLSNVALATLDTQAPKADGVDTIMTWGHGIEYVGPGASLLTTGRHPTQEERVLMNIMKYDTINLIIKYTFPQTLKTADKEIIDNWLMKNEELLDSGFLNTSLKIYKLHKDINNQFSPEFADELDAALKRSFFRRRKYLPQKASNNQPEKRGMDYWIEDIEKSFGGDENNPLMVKSIYLNTSQIVVVDIINVLNGSAWIEYKDGSFDNEQLLRLKDWMWVNRENVPDEVYKEMYKSILFDVFLAYGELEEYDAVLFEEFKAAKFASEMFDPYRNLPVIKME